MGRELVKHEEGKPAVPHQVAYCPSEEKRVTGDRSQTGAFSTSAETLPTTRSAQPLRFKQAETFQPQPSRQREDGADSNKHSVQNLT